jgi:microcystin-dependent protein
MSNQFIGEIRIFAGNFAIQGWAFCNGQILSISQNTALYSILGTNYGGNGTTNFGLPNLQDRAPIDWGQGSGLSPYVLGETGGITMVKLTTQQIPSHVHVARCNGGDQTGTQNQPTNGDWASPSADRGLNTYDPNPGTSPLMNPLALALTGGNQPHDNMPPYLVLNFLIAQVGIYPPRG